MDKQTANEIAKKLEAVLKTFAEENDMTVQMMGGKFDHEGMFMPKVRFQKNDADGNAISPQLAELRQYFPGAEGKTIENYNGKFDVIGFNRRASKYPLIAKCRRTGKNYKFPTSALRA